MNSWSEYERPFTLKVALIAVFAALFYAILWLPGIPAIGIPGLRIQWTASMASVIAMLLGPSLAPIAVLIGSVLKTLYPLTPFSIPFMFCPVLNAVCVSLMLRARSFYLAYLVPQLYFIAMLVLIYLTPVFYGYLYPYYVVGLADVIAATALVLPAYVLSREVFTTTSLRTGIGLFLVMFIGTEADIVLGDFAFCLPIVHRTLFGIPTEAARMAFLAKPLYIAIEHVLRALLAYLVAIPLLSIVRKSSRLRYVFGL